MGGRGVMNQARSPSLILYLWFDRQRLEASMLYSRPVFHYSPTFVMIDPPGNESTGRSGAGGWGHVRCWVEPVQGVIMLLSAQSFNYTSALFSET